jgi:hypothetical protein
MGPSAAAFLRPTFGLELRTYFQVPESAAARLEAQLKRLAETESQQQKGGERLPNPAEPLDNIHAGSKFK